MSAYDLEDDKKAPHVVEEVVGVRDEEDPHDVWGKLDANGPNYRGLGWIRASVVLTKIQIGLGVLAIPSVLHTLGFVPGILLIVITAIVVTWADYIVGSFKLNHPEVYTLADVGFLMWGPIGKEILGLGYWLYLTFVAGAGLIGISTALNAVSSHAVCTAVFVLVGAVINILISSIQTLDKISFIGWIGLIGIMSSIITLAIAVGIQDRPSAAPQTGPWDPNVIIVAKVNFIDGCTAASSIIFSFAGTPNFFNVVSEMKEPRHYFRSMYLTQTIVTLSYLIIGSVVYHFCGQYVSSPALGSAGITMKKVCYGLALPGLIVGCVLNTHLPAKYLFVRIMHKSEHFTKNSFTHYAVWYGLVIGNCAISFLLAEAVPIFGDIVSLLGAFLSTPLTLVVEGYMYWWDRRRVDPHGYMNSMRKKIVHILNWAMVVAAIFIWIAGTYASIVLIKRHVADGGKNKPFTCADNSV